MNGNVSAVDAAAVALYSANISVNFSDAPQTVERLEFRDEIEFGVGERALSL